MQPHTAQLLLDLNQRFYHDFGPAFAATHRRVQPGVGRAVAELPQAGDWLDLGCGSGQLARLLAQRAFTGRYLGLDSSAELLAEARHDPPAASGFSAGYRQADLSKPGWADGLSMGAWQVISCFAVLHHLPGIELRARLLQQSRLLLCEGGRLVHSVWQFQHSPKLIARILPWEKVGLSAADVEEGDLLLDWRYALPGQAEQVGLRYVHLFSRPELSHLAQTCGFAIQSEYESDGIGGRLGLYQVWAAI
jgi:tRNA (uracil-5-)-methyltransferase TRM9